MFSQINTYTIIGLNTIFSRNLKKWKEINGMPWCLKARIKKNGLWPWMVLIGLDQTCSWVYWDGIEGPNSWFSKEFNMDLDPPATQTLRQDHLKVRIPIIPRKSLVSTTSMFNPAFSIRKSNFAKPTPWIWLGWWKNLFWIVICESYPYNKNWIGSDRIL